MAKLEVTKQDEYNVLTFTMENGDKRQLKLSDEPFEALKAYFKKPSRKEKQPAKAPTLEEVKAYFKENGYTLDSAEKFFKYYENGNPPWTDGKGNPVRAWKQKCQSVWFKPENKIQEQTKQTSSFFR